MSCRRVVESLRDYAVVTLDGEGRVESWNTGAALIYGWPAHEIVGESFTRLYEPRAITDGRPAADLERARAAGHCEEEGWRVRRDGRRFRANVVTTVLRDGDGAFAGFSQVTRDVSDERAAEEARRESEELFRLMVRSVKDYAIFMLDPEGRVVSWNEGAERIKGWTASEIVGRSFETFHPQEDVRQGKTKQELEAAAREGRFEDYGWRVRKDGTRFWANVIITALFDPGGKLRGFSKVTRDITARVEAEKRLQRAYEDLESFSYSVSHDLRAPLRSLDGFSQILATRYRDVLDEQGRDYLDRVRRAAQRMGRLIDDLLNLSRLGRTRLDVEEIDLSALAWQVVGELEREEPGHRVEVTVEPALRARGDRNLLRIALENLFSNAWKYTARVESPRVEFGRHREKDEDVFFVRDNGAGFDMAFADKLFGAFQRLHVASDFPGTGIGLATVKRIVQRHGGEISASGEVGRGATFSFTLGSPEGAR